jgi:hypothetical protein
MSDPFLVTESLSDVLTSQEIIIVTPPVDEITLETDVLIGQGLPGPPGPSPFVSMYGEANAAIVAGVLTLNAAAASTFWVNMDQNCTGVVVQNWSSDRAQRIHVYTNQVSPGNWAFANTAFPAGTKWSYGTPPAPSAAGTIDSFVLEHLPTNNLVFGSLVGQMYA